MLDSKNWFLAIKRYSGQLWLRLCELLDDRAAKQEAAWAASLEYKYRLTNPDEAKHHRVPQVKSKKRT